MAEEKVKEIENGFDSNPPAMSEEGSIDETVLVKDVGNVEDIVKSVVSKEQEECKPKVTKEVPTPQVGNLRRHSTGTIGCKPQVQSRYRGNHRVASTHDLCKHGGKKCGQEDVVVKPWKNVIRRKSVETSEETSDLRKKSLGSTNKQSPVTTKPESSVSAAKRDALAMKKKPSASSVTSETSSVKEGSTEIARSCDGSSVKAQKTKKETGSAVVKKVPPGLRIEKSKDAIEKVSKISDNNGESSKVSALKNKEKAKIELISGEDVKEKTVCVVESSVKGVGSEKKKTMRSGHKSPTKKILASISTGFNVKKESGSLDLEAKPKPEKKKPMRSEHNSPTKKETGSLDLEANPKPETPKPEKKIRPKKTGVKVTLAKQLSFKRGKVLEPKPEDSSSPKWIKFRKRAVQEPQAEVIKKKKKLKVVETKPDACESSSKRDKVVLRHQAKGKKKMMTLFNNVIEETFNKLTKARKSKVKALVGAFETVISLQDSTKTSNKVQSNATTSASKVSPEQ